MRFLKSEFNDLQTSIKSKGLDVNNFHHVKKRGHLYVHQDGREDTFCFFRKKETILNDQLQWEDRVTYFLDPKNKISCESWIEVLVAFEKWLEKSNS